MTPAEGFRRRRAAVVERVAGTPVLLAAGVPRVRSYAAWTYPFRASSHFLYLVGRSLSGAALLLHDGRAELFVEPAEEDDELWHGPSEPWDALVEATGVDAVRPRGELADVVGPMRAAIATLPPQEAETSAWLSSTLDRQVVPNGGPRLVDGSPDARLADAMIDVRLRHDEHAIAQMRSAAEATAKAHAAGERACREVKRESEVRAAMEAALGEHAYGLAYGPIVTVHGEILHARGSDGFLSAGDLLLADFGAESAEGWACDVTGVWPVSGTFSPTQKALYDVVLRAQRAAIELVSPGVRYRDVHHRARRVLVEGLVELGILRGDPADLDARGAGDLFFPHGVGHLLGLDVHDMEDLGDRAGYAKGRSRVDRFGEKYLRLDRDLVPGMALTIEPGFYEIPAILNRPELTKSVGDALDLAELAKFADVRGIRLEDDVLVTESGRDVLTSAIPI